MYVLNIALASSTHRVIDTPTAVTKKKCLDIVVRKELQKRLQRNKRGYSLDARTDQGYLLRFSMECQQINRKW
jgi:hypothetical protein